jgi:hypothetical protein
VLAAAAGRAPAQAAPADDKGEPGEADKASDAAASAPAEPPPITVSGRVLSRFTAVDDDFNRWSGGFSLDSARVQVNYEWKKLSAEISFEVRGSVRDAYLDLELTDELSLRGGHFKLPATAIERTSTWTLPTIDRPLASAVLDGGLRVSGRRDGAQLTWRQRGGLHAKLEASVAQQLDVNGDERPGFLADEYAGVTATVRGELRPVWVDKGNDVRVGAFAQSRQVNYSASLIDRYWTGGVDLEADLPALGLRLWADVVAGTGHFGRTLAMDDDTPFVVAQAVLGWRRGGADRGKRFVEPFASFAYVNPTTAARGDVLTESKLGVAAGRWKRWRAQAQVAYRTAPEVLPVNLVGFDEVDPIAQRSVTLQLGTAF